MTPTHANANARWLRTSWGARDVMQVRQGWSRGVEVQDSQCKVGRSVGWLAGLDWTAQRGAIFNLHPCPVLTSFCVTCSLPAFGCTWCTGLQLHTHCTYIYIHMQFYSWLIWTFWVGKYPSRFVKAPVGAVVQCRFVAF